MNAGLERADSYAFNPHKWLLTNFDCTAFWVRDRGPLLDALAISPAYLRNEASDSGRVVDYRDWQVPLGRRFRALKLWFVLRTYGASGLRDHVRRHVRWARETADWIDAHPSYERVAPVPLGLVCFRHAGGDDRTRAVQAGLDAGPDFHLTPTEIDGRPVIRLAVGGTWTEAHHVAAVRDLLDELA